MTTIRATCPTCGEVELTPDDIQLRLCKHAPASYYKFECPVCRNEIQKPADDRIVQLLISGGVTITMWELSPELSEAHYGPPITIDDLIDFHIALQHEDFLAEIA